MSFAAQQGNDGLQRVAVLAGNSHSIALNACLHLLLRVLDQANNLLGLFSGDALLQGYLLAHAFARGRLHLAVSQVLERDAALDQLLRQDVLDRFSLYSPSDGKLNGVVAFER